MKAGRELDKRVAIEVMEWTYSYRQQRFLDERGIPVQEWEPSHRIDHAWQVVEKMKENGYNLHGIGFVEVSQKYHCMFALGNGMWDGFAETAPLAISLAALKAVGE